MMLFAPSNIFGLLRNWAGLIWIESLLFWLRFVKGSFDWLGVEPVKEVEHHADPQRHRKQSGPNRCSTSNQKLHTRFHPAHSTRARKHPAIFNR
jgi:hypothetical protein